MKTLVTDFILGMGEVGQGILDILAEGGWDVRGYDVSPLSWYNKNKEEVSHADVLHVCIPFDQGFVLTVGAWQKRLSPGLTIVHSTVPVGTCRSMGVVSSPVVGMHPDMAGSMHAFVKFFGGARASEAAERFRRCGLQVYVCQDSRTTEFMKLMDTLLYGVCVEFTKEVAVECAAMGVPFEAWTLWTDSYNRGYQALGHPEYARPNLVPIQGNLGGHCVLNNARLVDNDFSRLVLRRNGEDGEEGQP